MTVVAGVDVSKATLEVSVSESNVCRFENSGKGVNDLLKYVALQEVSKVVCESTGGYERLLVKRLREGGVSVQVAHPLRVRAFARACGVEAKTDPLDAQVLSRYGLVFSDSDTARPDSEPEREDLRNCWAGEGSLWTTVCESSIDWTKGRQQALKSRQGGMYAGWTGR